MIDPGELFENAINHWRDNRGVGTAIISHPLNDKLMVLGVLQRIYSKSPTANVVIVTNTFNERQDLIEFITQQENEEENNKEFKDLISNKRLKVLTDSFVANNKSINWGLLCIWYRPETICQEMLDYVKGCKFRLVVLNKLPKQIEQLNDIYKLAPLLPDFQNNEIEQIRLSTPVEEIQIGVDIPKDSEAEKLLKYYDEYISTSLAIFGSFDVIQQARVGNTALNISAMQICYQLAQENGWNEHLDMSVEFNIEIDRLYNPNCLKDRASQTYEIIRERSNLLSSCDSKLDVILDIVKENSDKNILIINKKADFASSITSYLNTLSETPICGNYHDKVDNIPAIDIQGNPIYYKSGAQKGERKMMGAKAQKTLNEGLFNLGRLRVLSTNSAPDKSLNITVDIIIITSPMCEDINTYIYRMSNLYFNNNRIKLYTLYCNNTTEQRLLDKKDLAINHNVKNSTPSQNIIDYIVVD